MNRKVFLNICISNLKLVGIIVLKKFKRDHDHFNGKHHFNPIHLNYLSDICYPILIDYESLHC